MLTPSPFPSPTASAALPSTTLATDRRHSHDIAFRDAGYAIVSRPTANYRESVWQKDGRLYKFAEVLTLIARGKIDSAARQKAVGVQSKRRT